MTPSTITYWIRVNCKWTKVTTSYAKYASIPRAVATGACGVAPFMLSGSVPRLPALPAAPHGPAYDHPVQPLAALAPPPPVAVTPPAQPDFAVFPAGNSGPPASFGGFGGGPGGGGGPCCAVVVPPPTKTACCTVSPPPPRTNVPEPSSVAVLLLALGIMGMVRYWRISRR